MEHDRISNPNKETPTQKKAQHHLNIMELMNRITDGPTSKQTDSSGKVHPFWDTQPVPKATDELPQETPYALPEPFRWVNCDVTNNDEISEIYDLLTYHYVEDDEHMFRFDYSKEFLCWALCPPGYYKDWHIGIRTDKDKLVAFISGIPCTMAVHGHDIKMAEINFLCIHSKLRSKRLAPSTFVPELKGTHAVGIFIHEQCLLAALALLCSMMTSYSIYVFVSHPQLLNSNSKMWTVLIKEITRRVNLTDIWQAVYTAGLLVTKPVAECTYYHRALNVKKLLEVNFIFLKERISMSLAYRLYRVPEETQISNLRPMTKADVSTVTKLLLENMRTKCKLYPVMSEDEVAHALLPQDNVIVSYVRELNGQVTDLMSFYILNSSVLRHEKHKTLKAAYAFYSVASTVTKSDLISDMLVIAKKAGMDVFNCLDQSENMDALKNLKFGQGDGTLKFYLYNYICPQIACDDVGLIMF